MRRLLLVPLALLALLLAAPPSGADEAEEADKSAWVEEALEECEADPLCEDEVEAEEAEAVGSHPAACVLRSAKAHAILKNNKLKLTIDYTTSEPTKAVIKLRYGATNLGSLKRHLRLSGVLRVSTKLKNKRGNGRSPLRIEIDPEGVGCPSRRLVLFPG
ncbi:MAG TPA: hypothetical protein VFY04_08275 [Solirubrobacterales bacterium]|nr:hypothetical protein [Solirubrobacterales bacterium]